MDTWNYSSRGSQQQGHSQTGQLGYPPVSYGSQQGAASVPTTYGSQLFSQPSFGQTYGQQILGAGGKSVGSDDYQGVPGGPAGMGGGSSVNISGIYGLDSKFPSSGYGGVGGSPATFNQKADQLSALGQYSKTQSQFLAADGHTDALKRFSETQLLQTALRQGTALDAAGRSQSEYLSAGRSSTISGSGGAVYGSGRELLGSNYGVTRSEAEAALLGSQVGLAARGGVGVLPFQPQAADSLGSLAGGRGLLGAMYPPAAGYSSLDLGPARSAMNGMSDLAGIGSTRYDRLDDRMALRYDFERRDDDRRMRERSRERDRDRERERERDRSWERERERERERLRERERARERERQRDRERARERERERERELRRRERTPPRILPPPRRDDKAGKIYSPPPLRFSSPHKTKKREYVCKVESFSLVERERDLLSLIRRYPRLYVSQDFSKVVTCWKEGYEIPLNQPVSFEPDAVDAEEENDAKDVSTNSMEDAETLKENVMWSVKVMLMSGATGESMKDLLSDSSNEEKPAHLHNFLRFVVFRKDRSALMAVGGAWDNMLDGGDPATDESSLIHTATRCVRDALQLDLSGVSSWRRFMEVHYDRVRDNGSVYKEIAVFFIPDLSGCLPPLENWKLQWKQRSEARLKNETSQKHEKDGKSGESPKGSKEKTEKQEDKDKKKEDKDLKNEERVEKDVKRDEQKDKDIKEDKKDVKKDNKKEKESKNEEKKNKDAKKDDKKDKDVKKEDKKEKDSKHEEKKEKDVKKEDKKQKDRKNKVEKKDKDERKDEEKGEKDMKATKGRGSDKKGKTSDSEAPEIPGFFVVTNHTKTSKTRAMTISLDGLLDYDERDKEESTFELSLFGEVFQEMLQYRFGSHILETFESLHRSSLGKKKEEKKRGRHEKDTKSSTNKKSKFSDSATLLKTDTVPDEASDKDALQGAEQEDNPKPVKDIDAAMQEASLINFDELEEELQETQDVPDADGADEDEPAEEAKETKKLVHVDEELLKAFRYFDKNRLNYLKAEDVRRLVHILGKCLTRRWVKDLTATALSESRSKDDCLYYKKLVEKEPM